MEQVMEDIESKMRNTDARLDTLALQVCNIEHEIFHENQQEVEVNHLLKSVHQVKDNYQNLRREILEVQDLQKQLSSSLNSQLKVMKMKFNTLKEKVTVAEYSKLNGSGAKSKLSQPNLLMENNK